MSHVDATTAVEHQLLDILRGVQLIKHGYGGSMVTPEGVLLAHGRFWTPAALPPDIKRGPRGECFRNAWSESCRQHWTYTEGWAVPEGVPIPIHHGWIVDIDGAVIDPTWNPVGTVYFGIPFNRMWGNAVLLRKRVWCGLLYENDRLTDDPERFVAERWR